jgi:hypothetical protein
MKMATFLLEDRKLSPNEALSADKRAYSRAVHVYTDAVALLQDRIVGRRCVASAAQWISKIEKSARNQSAYVSAQKQRVRRAKECRARAAAENLRLSVQMSYPSPLRCQNACQEGKWILPHGSEGPRIHMNGSITTEQVPYKSNHKRTYRL